MDIPAAISWAQLTIHEEPARLSDAMRSNAAAVLLALSAENARLRTAMEAAAVDAETRASLPHLAGTYGQRELTPIAEFLRAALAAAPGSK